MKNKLTFEQWIAEVVRIGIKCGLWDYDTTPHDLDMASYREMFYDDGYTPEETVWEEISSSEPD